MKKATVIAGLVWLDLLRRKDVYVLGVLLIALLASLLSIDVFGLSGATRYALDLGLLLSWFFSLLLAIKLTARQLPGEERSGTIYPLLAKPLSRGALLTGKWLGAWSGTVAATALFYLMSVSVVLLKGQTVSFPTLFQAMLLHAGALAVVCALALLLSTRSNADAAGMLSWVVVVGSSLIVPRVPRLAAVSDPLREKALMIMYYLLPHFELFDLRMRLIHDWGAAPWWPVLGAVLYAAVLTASFLILAWLSYRRKVFVRGAAQ